MAALTEAQIALLRLDMGDACSALTEGEMQLAYDQAEGNDCQTRVLLYRWAIAKLKPEKLRLVDGREVFSNATAKLYRERMQEWLDCAGTSGATLRTGVLSLGIDSTDADLTGG